MKCLEVEELFQYLNQQLDAARIQEITRHVSACPSCQRQVTQLQELVAFLAEDEGEFDAPSLCDDVLQRLPTEHQELGSSRGRWYPYRLFQWSAAPAALVLAITVLLMWPRVPGTGSLADPQQGFQARSGAVSALDRWVSLKVYKATPKGHLQAGGHIRSNQYLAFAYLNRPASTLGYLMVLGVDHRGEVHWYYPAHLQSGKNPCSLAIQKSTDWVKLPEEVGHSLPAGEYRIWAVFSKRPLCVEQVEAVVRQDLARAGALNRLEHLSLSRTAQHYFSLTVQSGPAD